MVFLCFFCAGRLAVIVRFAFWTGLDRICRFGGGWGTALLFGNCVLGDHRSKADFSANARAWASHMAGCARLLMSFVSGCFSFWCLSI